MEDDQGLHQNDPDENLVVLENHKGIAMGKRSESKEDGKHKVLRRTRRGQGFGGQPRVWERSWSHLICESRCLKSDRV